MIETKAVLAFLNTRTTFPITKKQVEEELELQSTNRKVLVFAAALLEIFGRNHTETLRKRLDPALQQVLVEVDQAFYEILSAKSDAYLDQTHPKTKALEKKYKPNGLEGNAFFTQLRKKAWATLPFLQKRMIADPSRVKVQLEGIMKVRRVAFQALCWYLTPDHLKNHQEKNELRGKDEEKFALTHLFWTGGGLLTQEGIHLYSSLIDEWAALSPENEECKRALLEQGSFRSWIKPKADTTPTQSQNSSSSSSSSEERKTSEFESFHSFLIQRTLNELEQHLKTGFRPGVRKYLGKWFLADEDMRLAVLYSILRGENLDNEGWLRFIKSLEYVPIVILTSLRYFQSVVNTYSVSELKRPALLEMIIFRCTYFDQMSGELRKPQSAAIDIFMAGWSELEQILRLIAKRPLDLSIGREEVDPYLQDPYVWPLLFQLIQTDQRRSYRDLVTRLAAYPQIRLTPCIIYRFLEANSQKEVEEERFVQLSESYGVILQRIQAMGQSLAGAEKLFLDPPIRLSEDSEALKSSDDKTFVFLQMMDSHQFQFSEALLTLFRTHLFDPFPQLFELLDDAKALNIEGLTENNVFDCLPHPLPRVNRPITPLAKEKAKQITQNLQKSYDFNGPQCFSLYLEMLFSIDLDDSLAQVSEFVLRLKALCPGLTREDIFFLFRYQPEGVLELLKELEFFHKHHINTDRNKFILPQEFIHHVDQKIDALSERLGVACRNYELRDKFVTSIRKTLILTFFPPVQPLMDMLRIERISGDKVKWYSTHLATHEGQLKQIKKGPIGVYLNWDVIQGNPTLFLSVTHLKKKSAHSDFIVLNLPIQRIVEKGEEDFFSVLYRLGQSILQESGENIVLKDPEPAFNRLKAIKTREAIAHLETCFLGLSGGDGSLEVFEEKGFTLPEILEIWKFLIKLKLIYRNFYLNQMLDSPSNSVSSSPKIAKTGSLFPSIEDDRAILIPHANQVIEPYPKFYSPNGKREEILPLREAFLNAKSPAFLPIPFVVTSNGVEETPYPVSYLSQEAEGLLERKLQDGEKWDERAPAKEDCEGRFVTLSIVHSNGRTIRVPLRYSEEVLNDPELFLPHFDFHTLILKARCYREL